MEKATVGVFSRFKESPFAVEKNGLTPRIYSGPEKE